MEYLEETVYPTLLQALQKLLQRVEERPNDVSLASPHSGSAWPFRACSYKLAHAIKVVAANRVEGSRSLSCEWCAASL